MLVLSLPDLHPVAKQSQIDLGYELRLDLFPCVEIEAIRSFLEQTQNPVILTLRKKTLVGEEERKAFIIKYLDLHPPYFDLEYDIDPSFFRFVIEKYLKTKFIVSYHNFEQTPSDLEEIYSLMQKKKAYHYKIACLANSTNDALKLLLFAKKHAIHGVSVISMGERGQFARVLGPVVGNWLNFAALPNFPTAPGQLTVSELLHLYNFSSLNSQTSIYGLIGDPVEKSIGHIYHNKVFRERNVNAVYVKMRVKAEELAEFVPLATELGIKGLSVTIPHKEQIVPFLKNIEPLSKEIGAINTICLENMEGTNTDGVGALDAIEKKMKVAGKKIVLFGAGGSARAIAFEAKKRGAFLVILNRNEQRAKDLAKQVGSASGKLEEVPHDTDILINCTPELPIHPAMYQKAALAMDVVYEPRKTPFLQEAEKQGCELVFGEEMFVNQAKGQTAYWIG